MKHVYRTHNTLKPLPFRMILSKRVSVSLLAFADKETLLAMQIRTEIPVKSSEGNSLLNLLDDGLSILREGDDGAQRLASVGHF